MNSDEIRVLFVDDDSLVLSALKRILRAMPFASWFTTDAVHALQLIGEEDIDVVVTDQVMPQMLGVELLSLVRAQHPGVVRVLLTGQPADDVLLPDDRLLHRLLHKPWDNDTLCGVLTRIVEALREHRDNRGDSTPIRAA